MTTEDELVTLLDAFCAALAARDGEALKALLDDDACFVGSETVVLHDRPHIEAFVDDYAAGSTSFSFAWDSCQASDLGDDAGWVAGFGREVRHEDGTSTEIPVRMTLACRRRPGGWRIAHVHTSTPRT